MSNMATIFLECRKRLRDAAIADHDVDFDFQWENCKYFAAVLIGKGCK